MSKTRIIAKLNEVTDKKTKDKQVLIFVHAKWCPYTVAFYPIWTSAKKMVNKDVDIIEINDKILGDIKSNEPLLYKKMADYNRNTKEYKLFFPTVILFSNGKRFKFEEDRTVDNLCAFVKSHTESKKQHSRNSSKHTHHHSLQEKIDNAFKRLFK